MMRCAAPGGIIPRPHRRSIRLIGDIAFDCLLLIIYYANIMYLLERMITLPRTSVRMI